MTKQETQDRIKLLEHQCDTLREQAIDAVRDRDDVHFELMQTQKENCPGLLKVIKTLSQEIKTQEGEIRERESDISDLEDQVRDLKSEKEELETIKHSI